MHIKVVEFLSLSKTVNEMFTFKLCKYIFLFLSVLTFGLCQETLEVSWQTSKHSRLYLCHFYNNFIRPLNNVPFLV